MVVRVYYSISYFKKWVIEGSINKILTRLISCVPRVCVDSDQYIQMPDLSVVSSYDEAVQKCPHLLTYDERILSRRKIIVSQSQLLAFGGYGTKVTKLDQPQQVIIASVCGCQFDVAQLDFKLFIHNDHLLWAQYLQSTIDDVSLWLQSIEHFAQMRQPAQSRWPIQLRVCPIGGGFFATTPASQNLAPFVQFALLVAFAHVLSRLVNSLKCIDHIEFTHFDIVNGEGPSQKVQQVVQNLHDLFPCTFTNSDICEPLPRHQAFRQLAILNPSDTFAEIGNEFEYSSVESAIGNNTTLRSDQSFRINADDVLNSAHFIGVHI